MANQPRRHHYVPQFYLAGFTSTGCADGKLYVLDKEQLKRWPSTPKGAAHQRDYHAVDLGSEHDPMTVEKALAICEGKWSAVLRSVIDQQTLPQDDSFADLLAFVAFMAVRVPRIRERVANFFDAASKSELRATFATPEGREGFRQAAEAYCQTLGSGERVQFERLLRDDGDLQEMARFVNSDGYTIGVDQTWNVQTMIHMALRLLPVLGLRQWGLWTVAEDAPDLICSDSPVCLTWVGPAQGPYPPGYGLRNTLLTVPLSRRLVLASTFEGVLAMQPMNRIGVASVNTRTAMFADQLFLPEVDFVWEKEGGRIANATDLLDALRSDRAPR